MSHRNDPIPASVGLFGLAPDTDPQAARWAYPCGVCNEHVVHEPGEVCVACADPAKARHKPSRRPRQTTASKPTASKTAAGQATGKSAGGGR